MINHKKHSEELDNIQTHNEDAESACIGALVLENESLYEVIDFLKPEMFYIPFFGNVYQAILNLTNRSEGVDYVTIQKELTAMKVQHSISDIAGLTEDTASGAHVEIHARIILQEYIRREFTKKCLIGLQQANDQSLDIADIIDEHVYSIEHMSDETVQRDTEHVGEIVKTSLKHFEQRVQRRNEGKSAGIHTGLKVLDKIFNGFQNGAVYILAGRPGMGKSAFALHIARKTAQAGNSVMFFSLEMTREALVNRMLIADSGISGDGFKHGDLVPEEYDPLMRGANRMDSYPIYINDKASTTIQNIRAEAKKYKRRGECDIIIVDYLQLINSTSKKNYSRNDEVSELSRNVKLMAKELDVPVLMLSQLNRETEKNGGQIPMLSNLRDSGAIEQDADAVMFIHRPWMYNDSADRNEAIIRIAKNREGETGDIKLWVSDDVSQFRDAVSVPNRQTDKEMPF